MGAVNPTSDEGQKERVGASIVVLAPGIRPQAIRALQIYSVVATQDFQWTPTVLYVRKKDRELAQKVSLDALNLTKGSTTWR